MFAVFKPEGICKSCNTANCIFQTGIDRKECAYYTEKEEKITCTDELMDKLCENPGYILSAEEILEAIDRKLFEYMKESGDIKEEFALILHPKHIDIIPELWYKAGIIIPIVWSPFAEEEKCYVVTDKNFVRNARVNMHSMFGMPGWKEESK